MMRWHVFSRLEQDRSLGLWTVARGPWLVTDVLWHADMSYIDLNKNIEVNKGYGSSPDATKVLSLA